MDAIRKRMRQRIALSMSQNCSLRTDSQVERGLELSAAWGRKTFSSPEPHVPLAGEAKGTGGSGDENEKKGVPTFFSPGPGQARFASLADFLLRPSLPVRLFAGYKTDKTKAVAGINSVSRLG